MKKKTRCKVCSTDRMEKDGIRELRNNCSEFCIECEKWVEEKITTKEE